MRIIVLIIDRDETRIEPKLTKGRRLGLATNVSVHRESPKMVFSGGLCLICLGTTLGGRPDAPWQQSKRGHLARERA